MGPTYEDVVISVEARTGSTEYSKLPGTVFSRFTVALSISYDIKAGWLIESVLSTYL